MKPRPAALYLPSRPDRADQDTRVCLGWATANSYTVTAIATAPAQWPDLLRLLADGTVCTILVPNADMIPAVGGIIPIAEATSDPSRPSQRRTRRIRPDEPIEPTATRRPRRYQ